MTLMLRKPVQTNHAFQLARRQALRCLASWGALAWGAVPALAATTASLPVPKSLAESLTLALRLGQPLVVMVSLEGCAFCKVARSYYLAPLQREGLPVVQIDMRTATPVQDFQALATNHDALVRQWNVRVAPTVLFFGPGGVELAERLQGVPNADYYGTYLNQRITAARAALSR